MIIFFFLKKPHTYLTTGNIGEPDQWHAGAGRDGDRRHRRPGARGVRSLGPKRGGTDALIVAILVTQSARSGSGRHPRAARGCRGGLGERRGGRLRQGAGLRGDARGRLIAAGIELYVRRRSSWARRRSGLGHPSSLQKLSSIHVFGFELASSCCWSGGHPRARDGAHALGPPCSGRRCNEAAARLAGVAVRRTKVIAFWSPACWRASPACSSSPATATSPTRCAFLLPAYAAAFFGAAGVGRRGFSVPSTLFGALYLSVLANG